MVSIGARVLRASVQADGVQVAQAQFIVRKFAKYVSLALCTRGPLWLQEVSAKDKAAVYKQMRRTLPLDGLRFMMVTPNEVLDDKLGLPVMLDISQPMDVLRAQLDKRWRHRLGGAEKSELNVQRMGTNPGQYRWLLDAEMQQRAERNIDGMPLVWFERYAESRKQPSRNLMSLRADVGRDRVAGMMFLIHGEAATYQVGWTSDAGRDLHAHNLMLWRAIEELRERGVRSLDLGGVNTQRSAGIARFKMSTGGSVLQLAGSYLL
jgi:lipid II:glycine glycyltransferase (peptidoglycan interpeptide bridge formation enzyme)